MKIYAKNSKGELWETWYGHVPTTGDFIQVFDRLLKVVKVTYVIERNHDDSHAVVEVKEVSK